MPVSIRYDDDARMIISDLTCPCPLDHQMPKQDIYVGANLLSNLPKYIERRGLGRRCVLVADKNTYPLAGQAVERALQTAGFTVIPCVIRRAHDMDPDERAVGEVLLSIQPDTEFLVSVGSGSITDTARVNAARTNLPFVCVGTAPSMDGYTSVIAPLLLRGVKIHRAGPCPEIIVCDTDILRTAPDAMIASGVGDVLGKYIAKADWKIGRIINGEVYCDVCGEIVTDAINKLIDNVAEIRQKSEKGIRILIEALLLAGVTIMIVGHTRAVASVEHNIAHYWEMMQLLHGNKPPAHGASVGVATLLVWPMFTRFMAEDLSALDIDAIRKNRVSREARVAWMYKAFEKEAAESIMRDNEGDFLPWDEQLRRVRAAQQGQQAIRDVLTELPPYEKIVSAMHTLGAPMTPAEVGVDDCLLNLSVWCAKDYRTRYTLFKLIDECGLSEKYWGEYGVE